MVDRTDWIFLLQQEGDQSWLPLESPDVEILEGRYRVLARSRYRNASVSVRLSHVPSLGAAPMSRQRSIHTDGNGLAAVLTFMSLQPGLWHIDCQGDDWHTSVQLHVLERVEEDLGDWQPDWEAEYVVAPMMAPELPNLGLESPKVAIADGLDLNLEEGDLDLSLEEGDLDLNFEDEGLGLDFGDAGLVSNLEDSGLDLNLEDDGLDLNLEDGGLDLNLEDGGLDLEENGADLSFDMDALNFSLSAGESGRNLEDISLDPESDLDLESALDFETDLGLDDLDLSGEDFLSGTDLLEDDRPFDLSEDIRSTTIEPRLSAPDLSLAFEMDPIEPAIEPEPMDLSPGMTFGFPETPTAPVELSPGMTFGFPEAEAESVALSPGTTLGFPEADEAAIAAADDPFNIPSTAPLEEPEPQLDEPRQDDSPTPTELSLMPVPEPSWAESLDDLDFTESGDALTDAEPQTAATLEDLLLEPEGNPQDSLSSFAVDSHLSLVQESTAAFAAMKPPVPSLVLDQDLYDITPGLPLNLTGRIAADTPGVLGQSELVAILRDPQAAKVVAEQRQPLQNQPLPIPFVLTLSIPAAVQAQLLIGELTLWNDGVDVLAQQTFTAIANPEVVAATLPEPEPETPKLPLKEIPMNQFSGVDFSFFDLIGSAPESVEGETPTPTRESLRDVDLPSFNLTPEPDLLPDWEDPALADALADDPLNLDVWGDDGDVGFGDLGDPGDFDAAALDLNLESDVLDLNLESEALDLDLESGDLGSPDLQLIADAEPIPVEAFDLDLANALFEPAPSIAQEVVIDDLPEQLPTPRPVGSEANPLLIPDSEEIPVPEIEVAAGELVTGQAIQVKVILPNILAKLYVKLWIHDRQSRTMLDGPRWLVDFVPNGKEALEAVTQLTVPFGSVEIQIAAIAVEAATKRESYRTTVDRTVSSPNLNLDDLDFDLNL